MPQGSRKPRSGERLESAEAPSGESSTVDRGPMFSEEEIETVRTIAGLIGGDGMLVGPLPNGSAILNRIAQKMSAPSEKP